MLEWFEELLIRSISDTALGAASSFRFGGEKPRIKISLVFLWVRNLDSVMAFGVCQRGVAEPFSSEFPPNTFPGRVGVYRTCCWRELEEGGSRRVPLTLVRCPSECFSLNLSKITRVDGWQSAIA